MKFTQVTGLSAVLLVAGVLLSCATKQSAGSAINSVEKPTTITFLASDGVTITADLYMAYDDTAPLILLCHRAQWSRGEYLEIAPKLNKQGFNAIAIDQRSGKTKNNIDNQTAISAKAAGMNTAFVDAQIDIQSAIEHVKTNYAKGRFILFGSSYSASLGVVAVKANPGIIDAYIAFSPGEYFADQGKSADWIRGEASGVSVPVFFSSKNSEQNEVRPIFEALASSQKTYYCPSSESKHGAEALYESNDVNVWTWNALNSFLSQFSQIK